MLLVFILMIENLKQSLKLFSFFPLSLRETHCLWWVLQASGQYLGSFLKNFPTSKRRELWPREKDQFIQFHSFTAHPRQEGQRAWVAMLLDLNLHRLPSWMLVSEPSPSDLPYSLGAEGSESEVGIGRAMLRNADFS